MKKDQSTTRSVVFSISVISVLLSIYALLTCYGGALNLLLKGEFPGVRHDDSVQRGINFRRDGFGLTNPSSIHLVTRDDTEEQKDDPTPSSNENPDSTTSGLASSGASSSKSFGANLLSKTWFRVVLALLGIVVLHMLCVCFHHVYHVLSRGTKPYGKLEYSQSPF